MNLFEQAVRQQTKFNFRGVQNISTMYAAKEAVSTKSPNSKSFKDFVSDLKQYGVQLTEQAANFNKQSIFTSPFEDISSTTKEQEDIELKLAIVTLLLTELYATVQTRANTAEAKRIAQKALAIKAKRQESKFESLSDEELDKLIAMAG